MTPVGAGPQGLVPEHDATARGFRVVGGMNASFATGAHVQTHAGPTSVTRGAVSLSYGIGLTPGVLQVARVGVGVSGTANASARST
ncbi:hypothetical protein NGM37_25105, partial [Streptomyces sp. TRM76130]|nr:hypothetical protein [Streptomyces sp. TRM76130]